MKKMSAIVVSSFLIMHTKSIPCVLSRISQPRALANSNDAQHPTTQILLERAVAIFITRA